MLGPGDLAGVSRFLSEAGPLVAGARLGPYLLEAEIGRGGMAVVWRARHVELGRSVALKFLHGLAGANPVVIERFRREALATAGLGHPAVVTVYDAGEFDGLPFIAMELVEGGSLAERLRGEGLTLRQVVEVLAGIADALQHAHDRGIVHRDLKPHNILIDSSGRPRLADFGIARISTLETLTRSNEALGSPAYMSPEQVDGRPVGPPSDLFSLGVILYETVTGRLPFDGRTVTHVFESIRATPPRPPREIVSWLPVEIEDVCLRLLEKDPARRYPGAGALAADLRRFLRGEPLLVRPHRLHALVRRRRWPIAVAAAIAAILLGLLLPRTPPPDPPPPPAILYISVERELDILRHKFYQPGFRLTDEEFARYEVLVTRVREEMTRTGDAAQGWYVIGRCRQVTGDESGAIAAYGRALELDSEHAPSLLARGRLYLEGSLGSRAGKVRDPSETAAAADQAREGAYLVHRGAARSDGAGMEVALAQAYADVIGSWEATRSFAGPLARWQGEPFVEEWLLLEVIAAGSARKPEAADELLRRVPSWDRAHYWNAVRLTSSDPSRAIAGFSRALEINPRYSAAWNSRAVVRRQQGDLDGAIADYSRALELDPRFARAWNNRGVARLAKNDFDGAIDDLTRALDLKPGDSRAMDNRGLARRCKGDLEGALADHARALELDPDFAPAWNNRGEARYNWGDREGALADFSRALELDANLRVAWNNRGLGHYQKGDLDAALADLSRAIELDPRRASAWNDRGAVRRDRRDLDGAIADFSRALELEPSLVSAWSNRGNARRDKGDRQEAIADLSHAIELDPRFAAAFMNRGLVHRDLGDRDGARRDFERALEVAPPNWPNRAQVERLLRGLDR